MGVGQAQSENGSRSAGPPGHCHHRSCLSCSDCLQGSGPFPAAVVAAAAAAAEGVVTAAVAAAAAGSLMGSFDPGEVKLVLT